MIRLMPGPPGASEAAQSGDLVIVVDSLRASATLCALFTAGAGEVIVCETDDQARDLKAEQPELVLVGEKNTVKPEGFDYENSPTVVEELDLAGRTVAFTSTNGAVALVNARGAASVIVGGVINASVAIEVAQQHLAEGINVSVVPSGDEGRESEEDLVAACLLADGIGPDIAQSQEIVVNSWKYRIGEESLQEIFRNSSHGQRLVQTGKQQDIITASDIDRYQVVPTVREYRNRGGITLAVLHNPSESTVA